MTKFTLAPIEEIHLRNAPLAKVLTQVAFSRTPSLTTDAAEAQLAEHLGRYPVRRRQLIAAPTVVIGGQSMQLPMPPGAAPVVLTFSQPNGSWQATVTESTVAVKQSSTTLAMTSVTGPPRSSRLLGPLPSRQWWTEWESATSTD